MTTPQELLENTDESRCVAVCEYGGRCELPANHLPQTKHETEHGCIFYEDTPELKAKMAEARAASKARRGKP